MSRTPKNAELTPLRNVHAKRVCIGRDNPAAKSASASASTNESLLWPENDASFFSHVKLEEIFSGQDAVVTAPFSSQTSSNFNHSDSDDSLFGDIPLPSTIAQNNPNPEEQQRFKAINTADLSIAELQNHSDSDDSLFGDIPLPSTIVHNNPNPEEQQRFKAINTADLSIAEVQNIFDGADTDVQNTQLFLDAMPPPKRKQQVTKIKDESISMSMSMSQSTSFISKSILEGIVHGTQYETFETLKNRSMLQTQNDSAGLELDQFDWQTQAFPEFEGIKDKEKEEHDDSFPSKGDFYGLPDKVKQLIFEHKGINSLYDWQNECLHLPAIRQRKNLIYALPTSGGKTLVAEILMLRELLCNNRNVLFILPYVSIVQEKVSAMSPFAIAMDFIVDEYTAGKGKCPPQQQSKRRSLFIASIEKGAVLMDSLIEVERPHEIGLVVVDELHLIGERGRGATLEAFLTKVMFLNANIQIVGMSATIGNLNEISAFLNADVYTRGFRPVELKEYIKCGNDILEINSAGQTLEEIFVLKRSVNYNYSTAVERADPDHLAGLVSECAPEHCCLVFCPTRKNCENVALLLSRIVPKQKFFEHRQSEKVDLMNALDAMCGILSPVLAKTLPYGIAYHHSGLTTDERKYIETAYRFGVITVICCTSTLAAGVNLPAKRVIIRAPYVGQDFMTLCKYKQMVGRAGRAGFGEAGESFLITQRKDNLQVGEMLFSPMDKALSSLDQMEAVGLQSLILSVIGLNLADCRRDLNRLVNSTLLAVQAGALEVAVDDLVLLILRDMFKNKVLQLCDNAPKGTPNTSDIMTTQDVNQSSRLSGSGSSNRRLLISQSTRFQLTSIGRAAYKAGIDYKRAFAMHKELKDAQQQLILTSYVHLLYLVVCFNSNERGDELFPADANVLFREYTSQPPQTMGLFKQLGFTEALAARLAKTQSVQGPLALKLNRLYKVLILADVMDLMALPSVANKYNIERGTLQHLVSQSTSAASAIVRLCEQIDEFWCFKPLFERIHHKIDRCGTLELEPLLELPAVKINRAKQLYAKGFRTIEDVAKTRPMQLVKNVEFMPLKVAIEIVSAAKIILMKKLDHLEEATEALKNCLCITDE